MRGTASERHAGPAALRRLGLRVGFVVLGGISTTPASAQVPGRIVGRVIDRETGEPLIAAQIMIESSELGSFAREDGTYFIDRVPPGIHRVTTEYLGYEKRAQELRVPSGGVATANFALSSSMLDSPVIVAVVELPRWEPPETVEATISTRPLPERVLEIPPPQACVVEVFKRSAYIVDGRWELPRVVGNLRCGKQKSPCEVDVVMADAPGIREEGR